jgi:nicotinamide mononucleotide transporter
MNFSALSEQFAAQDLIEWLGLVSGIIYVILATYEKPSCWIFGIISSAAIAWKSFADYKLIADGILQLFYIIIGVAGLWNWLKGTQSSHPKPIIAYSFQKHVVAVLLCLLLSFPASMLLIHYAGARFGYIDTSVTLLSIWATILLVQKELYNWIYWIILDTVLVVLYFLSGGFLFSVLFIIYTLIAVFGFYHWRRHFIRI